MITKARFIWSVALGMTVTLFGAACSEPKADKLNTPAFAATSAGPTPLSAPAPMVFEGPGKLVPEAVGEWRISAPPRYFGPDNLYDLINGGAEVYVEYGLVKMVTVDYQNQAATGRTITVEVYDQGSPEGAFGRVSRFLAERKEPSNAGDGLPEALKSRGILGDGDVVFWKDRFLVHLTWLDANASASPEAIAADAKKILPELATAIAAKILGDAPPPADLALLPLENRVPRSEVLYPKGGPVLGAMRSVVARYTGLDGKKWTAACTAPFADGAAALAAAVQTKAANGELIGMQAGNRLAAIVPDGTAAPAKGDIKKLLAALAKSCATP